MKTTTIMYPHPQDYALEGLANDVGDNSGFSNSRDDLNQYALLVTLKAHVHTHPNFHHVHGCLAGCKISC